MFYCLAPGFRPYLAFVHVAVISGGEYSRSTGYAHKMPVSFTLGGEFDQSCAIGKAPHHAGTVAGVSTYIGRAVSAVHDIHVAQANLALVHIAADDALPLRLGWL